MIENQRI